MKRSIGEVIFDNINIIILIILSILTLYPMLHVIFASFSHPDELIRHQGIMIYPQGFSLTAYRVVLNNNLILSGYINTIIYVGVGTSLSLLLTMFCAYVLSRSNFYWKNPILAVILLTMFVSGGMIPMYLTVEALGLIDTRWAIILPTAISTYNMIIMRTGFASVSISLEESAKLDGANDFTILFRIFTPISKPIIAVIILYYGVANWNSWFNAMIYLRDRNLYPLQLLLREILILNLTAEMSGNIDYMDIERVGESIKYTTIVVATVPVLMIYPFLQKYFVKGIMIGSVKE